MSHFSEQGIQAKGFLCLTAKNKMRNMNVIVAGVVRNCEFLGNAVLGCALIVIINLKETCVRCLGSRQALLPEAMTIQ
jgi:hypothetical protein